MREPIRPGCTGRPPGSVRAVVADDEPLVRERVCALLAEWPEIRVVRECADGVQTLEVLRERKPDLLFLDIQMPELTGFQVLAALDADMPRTVFVTAHDDYALQAFEVNAVDYVLKPIRAARFHRAVARALVGTDAGSQAPGVRALAEYVRAREPWLDRFVVRARGRYRFVSVAEVWWIEAAQNYLVLHLGDRKELVRGSLTAAQARLDPERFLRVHRSAIVNTARVTAVEPLGHGTYLLHFGDGRKVRTSRSHSAAVRGLLAGLQGAGPSGGAGW